VTGPVIAIAVILAAVFVPTAFIPGITGQLYQQFAVTIAISVIISAFNALTLSPALCALLLKPKVKGSGPLQKFYDWIQCGVWPDHRRLCRHLPDRHPQELCQHRLPVGIAAAGRALRQDVPAGFLPDEDQGYVFAGVQLPDAGSLQRTSEIARQAEGLIIKDVPGVKYVTTVVGYSMLSQVQYLQRLLLRHLEEWAKRKKPEEHIRRSRPNSRSGWPGSAAPSASPFRRRPSRASVPRAAPPSSCRTVPARTSPSSPRTRPSSSKRPSKRPELASVSTTFRPTVPQMFIDVDRDKVLKQGVNIKRCLQDLAELPGQRLHQLLQPLRPPVAGLHPGRRASYRTNIENVGQFYVRNNKGEAGAAVGADVGPQHLRPGIHDALQPVPQRADQCVGGARLQFGAGHARAGRGLRRNHAQRNGLRLLGMSFQEQKAAQGVSPVVIFGFSLLCVFLILAAQYESWSLPFSVLLGTPIAVAGAFARCCCAARSSTSMRRSAW
jgi:HAE1 family hydrophobic/amphiphilic exporter-1